MMAKGVHEHVTSGANPRLKLVRRLQARRGRAREGAFAVEGEDLVVAGLDAGWPHRFLLADAGERMPDALLARGAAADPRTVPVDGRLLAEVSTLGHPPRVIGVFELPEGVAPEGMPPASAAPGPTVFLDGVADPGNVGTVVRTIQALGAGVLGLGPGTADPFGPKAVRASMGAIFRVATRGMSGAGEAASTGGQVVVLDATASVPLWDVELASDSVICIGGERTGVSDATRSRADIVASIPQSADALDSVNAAIAASLALYEWRRQQAGRS